MKKTLYLATILLLFTFQTSAKEIKPSGNWNDKSNKGDDKSILNIPVFSIDQGLFSIYTDKTLDNLNIYITHSSGEVIYCSTVSCDSNNYIYIPYPFINNDTYNFIISHPLYGELYGYFVAE